MTFFSGDTAPDLTMTVQPDCLKRFFVTLKYYEDGGADNGSTTRVIMNSSSFTIIHQDRPIQT